MDAGSLDFATTEPRIQLYFLLGLVYAAVTPVLLPFIVVFFAFSYVVFRHQVYLLNTSLCNKALMSNLGFPFATTLTSWHLMVTYCTLHVAQRLNFFETKSIDMKTVILFGILNGVSIGFLNLSLGFNSIGGHTMSIPTK